MEKTLTLKEKYVLLAYHPEKGRPLTTFLTYGLAGAILIELADLGKIILTQKRLRLVDARRTSDPVLDLVITKMASAKSSKKATTWIHELARFKMRRILKNMVLEELINKNILRKERVRCLFFFSYNKYLARDKKIRPELVNDLRGRIIHKTESGKDTLYLAALVGATYLVNRFFEKDERKAAKAVIRDITKNNELLAITNETVLAVQQAVLASVATATAVSAASSGGRY